LKLVADESRDLVVERMRTRPGKPFEIVGLKSNDTRINLEVIGKDHLHQGREVRLVCIRDITERKQAEAELRDSEARYRDYYQQAPDAYLSVDPESGLVIECNETTMEMLGRPRDDVIGHKVFEFYTPESFDRVQEALRELQDLGVLHGIELQVQSKDGTVIDVSLNATAVRDESGRVVRSRSTWRDITERKRAEETLQRLREELELRVETKVLRGNSYGLTFREVTVLHLISAGRADKEIASELGIRPHTASRHVKNIMSKMSATSRTDAGVRAVREELID
jgi:PAS domain S-box-containing protein